MEDQKNYLIGEYQRLDRLYREEQCAIDSDKITVCHYSSRLDQIDQIYIAFFGECLPR